MPSQRHRLSPNMLMGILLSAWGLLNLLQANWTELANDEAYYWYFSQHLDWGYFDHPPMVAFLIWLTRGWIGGELGVRLISVLLQPVGLYLFWTLLRPSKPSRRDAVIYFLACFSLPLLQVYGILALPDAPLLFFTVVFLWAFKRFTEHDNWGHALLLAVAMALLMYSKYHGALVILFALLSCLRIFRSPKFYVAVLLAVLLYTPHLWWLYTHDFVTLRYHLVDRTNGTGFDTNNLLGYLFILLMAFHPLWLYHYWKGLVHWWRESLTGIRRTLFFVLTGFVAFFLFASLRDNIQAQWLLPICFALVALLCDTARTNDRAYRHICTVSVATAILWIAVRLLVLFNPLQLKGELWNNKADNHALARLADGRPVLFMQNYTASCKYRFYTGGQAYTLPYLYDRDSQWRYDDSDTAFTGKEVLVVLNENPYTDTLLLPGGRQVEYLSLPNYKPLRKVWIEAATPLCDTIDENGLLPVQLLVRNPYPYDLYSTDKEPLMITFLYRIDQRHQPEHHYPLTDTLHAHSDRNAPPDTVCLMVAASSLPPAGEYLFGFSLRCNTLRSCLNSERHLLQIERPQGRIVIHEKELRSFRHQPTLHDNETL